MKWHISVGIIVVLCLCLFCSFPADQAQAQGTKAAPAAKKAALAAKRAAPVMPKITVLNPMGTPPPITRKTMVEPPATLEGKTIYFVNTGYIGTDRLMAVMEEWFKANYPKTNIVVKRSAGGMSGVDKNLWAEIAEKGDAAVVGLGHWSVCAPGAVRLSIDIESTIKKPAVPLIIWDFAKQEAEVSLNDGMPALRIQYFRGPVWAKTNEQLKKQIVEGNNPITGRPVMQELVEKLTKPLTAEEKKTGDIKPPQGPATFTGTPDELQQLFLDKRMTDFMPVILPTEEKVNEMLKGTSHSRDEVLGKMNPGSEAGENWTYTVKVAAINAVMAGARPEYFPVILALGSTGMTSVNVSDNGFAAGAVINGPIRDEIKLNYETGAVGPYALANTAIGRAWNLLSINGGNCGKIGTTYFGTVGNAQNALATIIAENERESPFKPLSVRRGFKENENIVTTFNGWGVLSAANWKVNVWGPDMNYPQIIKDIYAQQSPGLFGTFVILSPNIANFVKDAGYDTIEKLTEWVTQPVAGAAGPPAGTRAGGAGGPSGMGTSMGPGAGPGGPGGAGAAGGRGGRGGGFGGGRGGNFNLIVTGTTNNNYWMVGGLMLGRSLQIDPWR